MVEELNGYFASVLTVEDTSSPRELEKSQETELSVTAIIKEKVIGNLYRLKKDKSPRTDGLHPRALKERTEEIVEALVVIFQVSLESGRVQRTGKWLILHLEYGEQFWDLYLRKDVLSLEVVQKRLTRMILRIR
eukprot:g37698.t1